MAGTALPPSPPLERLLQEAVKHHQRGAFARAELLYRRVLAEQPAHAHALYLMGNLALAGGKAREAEAMLANAVLLRPGEPDYALSLGNSLAMQRRFQAAAQHYRHALRVRPRYAQARFNLANALRDDGQPQAAAAEYLEVIAAHPRNAAAQNNYANLLLDAGAADAALQAIERYLKIAPRDAAAHYNRGNILRGRGDARGAITAYRKAVRADPRFAPAQNNLGVLLHETGKADEAAVHYLRAIEIDPVHREALLNLAKIDVNARRHDAATKRLRRFLALEPDHVDARTMLAIQYLALRRLGSARTEFERLVAQVPDNARLRVNLANILQEMHQLEPAIEQFQQALRLDPSLYGAHYNLGITLRKNDRADEALPHLLQAQAAEGESHHVAHALANAYRDLGDYAAAERQYLRAIELAPDYHEVRITYSGVLIASGRFGEGWDHDSVRWLQPENAKRVAEYPQPAWAGESLAGRRVLVWTEQAPGDQVMFLEALPDLLAEARSVMLECSPRLIKLLGRSFPGVTLVPRSRPDDTSPLVKSADVELQMPMSALQRRYRRSWESFPGRRGFLRADAGRTEHWRARVAELGSGLKIGISWRGGTIHTQQKRRTISLGQWAPLLRLPGAQFVSLQYSDVGAELADLEAQHGIRLAHWQEAIDDFDESAALLQALDLVISVPTTVIHLAGGLGVPTWIMVPFLPGFRYMRSGTRMPWYPSVRLFRQPGHNQWESVFSEVQSALAEDLAPRRDG